MMMKMMMMMRGMDEFFPNGILHQIQKEKTISMMMKMMRGMDDFFQMGLCTKSEQKKPYR